MKALHSYANLVDDHPEQHSGPLCSEANKGEVSVEALNTSVEWRRPEAKLARLNKALLRLIGTLTASEFTRAKDVDAVREILRNTLLTEFLSERMLYAVAGPQGAGKTTLMRELYGLDPTWLRANPGLGEAVPILVVESEIESAQGTFWEVADVGDETHLVNRKVAPPEWQSGAKALGESVMVLELRVPMTFFGVPGMGFLLLPGYEMGDEDLPWQELMRRALIASPGAVVVTDEQLMATAQQERIVEDLRKLYRGAIRPTVCVSRTETLQSAESRQALTERAAAVFSVHPSSVVLTGTGEEYLKGWSDQLRSCIGSEQDPSSSRPLQLQQLVRILDVELRRILRSLEDEAQVDDLLESLGF